VPAMIHVLDRVQQYAGLCLATPRPPEVVGELQREARYHLASARPCGLVRQGELPVGLSTATLNHTLPLGCVRK
jgi:hypothetical protein